MPTPPAAPASDKPAVADAQATPGAPPPADISDVYGDFDAADKAEATPASAPTRKEPDVTPPSKGGTAKSAADQSDQDGEGGPKKKEDAAASSAGSEGGKDKDFKPLTDEQYAKLDKSARVAYNSSLRQQNAKLETELRTLRSEQQKTKDKPVDDGRVKQLEELLDLRDRRLKEVEEHLRMVAYEKSDEFKDKFHKPFVQAYSMGRTKAASMKLVERRNDAEEVIQASRQGTPEDFEAIMAIADDDAAYDLAEKMFGGKASAVMHYRERINELRAMSREAIEDRRSKSESIEKEQAEIQKRQAAEMETQNKTRAEAFRHEVEAGMKAHPEWFTPTEGDAEGQKIVDAGKTIAESLFTNINPRTGKPYTPEGMVRFHAFVRNAIAAHGLMGHTIKSLKTRIGDLEAQLAEFKESGTLEDAGRMGDRGKDGGLPGPEEFFEADKVAR